MQVDFATILNLISLLENSFIRLKTPEKKMMLTQDRFMIQHFFSRILKNTTSRMTINYTVML